MAKCQKNLGMEVIIDCEDLIGEDLRKKIGSYLNIVKIAVPIILIGFGIIEFTKAIFAGDEDKMKKAQKKLLVKNRNCCYLLSNSNYC